MAGKVIGIVLLIAGAAVILSGILGISGVFEGETPQMSGIMLRMFGGTFLLMGGAFTTAYAFRSTMTRGVTTFFKRLQGTRIDEEISRLAKLRADGYITGEEYEEAKKKLLSDL
jgi:hypothetical protein